MARKPAYHETIWHGGSEWLPDVPSTMTVETHDGPRSAPIGFAPPESQAARAARSALEVPIEELRSFMAKLAH